MKNITVSVENEVYRRARIRAAELETSVSAVVQKTLDEFARKETKHEAYLRKLEGLYAITHFAVGKRIPRDELYDRKRFR